MGRILNAAAELLHSSFQNAVVAKDAAKHVIAKHARTTSRGDAEVQRLGESTHPGYRQNSLCTINPKRAIWRASLWLRETAGVVGGRGEAARASSLGQRTALSSVKMQELVGEHGLSRAILVSVIGGASRLFMQLLTSVKVQGQEHLEAALSRPSGQALITVSNHVTGIDDPLVISRLVPARQLFGDARALRWTMCATDRCFKYSLLTPFFRACKVLPVERGAGLDQPGMHAAQALLSQGEWLHVFPEGTRSVDGRLGCVKPGVAALVAALDHEPVLLPFVHAGMERVVPRGKKVPRPGQRVAVVVGEPIPTADLKWQAQQQGWDEQHLLKELRNRVQLHLHRLKAEADALTLLPAHSSLSEVSSAAQQLLPQARSAAAAAASSASRWAEAAQWPLPSSFSVALAGACCQRPQAWLQGHLGVPSAADSWRSYLQGYAAERRRRVEALLSIGAC